MEKPKNGLHTLRMALLAAAALSTLAVAVPANAKVLATVNGTEITDDDVRIATQDLGPTLPAAAQGSGRSDAYVLDYLIDLKLAAAQGAKDGDADTADFARQMAYYRDKTLMEGGAGQGRQGRGSTDANEKQGLRGRRPASRSRRTEYHARHILVPTEAEAKAALVRVKAGEDFAKVADELSKDPGSQGGDLGWFTKDKMVPEFAEADVQARQGPGVRSREKRVRLAHHQAGGQAREDRSRLSRPSRTRWLPLCRSRRRRATRS